MVITILKNRALCSIFFNKTRKSASICSVFYSFFWEIFQEIAFSNPLTHCLWEAVVSFILFKAVWGAEVTRISLPSKP